MNEAILTVKEASNFLRVSSRTLFNLTAPRGPIPCVRVGRSVRYSFSALQTWIVQQQAAESLPNNDGVIE